MLSLETLSDLNKIVSMLRKPFKSIVDLLRRMFQSAAKRRQTSRRLTKSKAMADAWLEYRYGWRPLLMDADTLFMAAHRTLERSKRRVVTRAGDRIASSAIRNTDPHVHGGFSTAGSWSISIKKSVNVGVICDIKPRNSIEGLNELLGTRPSDLPASFWAVIPYSFVVDQFVGVQDWLQAITPVPGVDVRGHWATTCAKTIEKRSASCTWPTPAAPGTVRWEGSFGSEEKTYESVQRSCNEPLATTPVVKAKLISQLQAVDDTMLVVQQVFAGLNKVKH